MDKVSKRPTMNKNRIRDGLPQNHLTLQELKELGVNYQPTEYPTSPDNDDGRRWDEPTNGIYTIPDETTQSKEVTR